MGPQLNALRQAFPIAIINAVRIRKPLGGEAVNDGSNPGDEIVGPFYDAADLSRWLPITKPVLDARITDNEIIACDLADGTWVFPIWQFTDNRAVHPDLLEVWQVLRRGADPWTCGIWLCASFDALGGQSPVQWLIGGGNSYLVLVRARADADRWSQ